MPVARACHEGRDVVGLVSGGQFHPFPGLTSVLEALQDPGAAVDDGPVGCTAFLPVLELPVEGPTSLRDFVGFLGHVRNARRARGVFEELPQEWFERPAYYFANPDSLHASTAPVAVPPGCERFDLELEIAAVLTSGGANLTAREAAACIGGYVLYCDWSARDIQSAERIMQIGQGKGKDAAISLGPWILTAAEAEAYRREDGFSFTIEVRINDESVLRTPFVGMDWSFEELVAYASHGAGVRAGDLIASGTIPGGCLMELSADDDFRGWLQPGDHVVLDGGPLGTISAPIAPPTPFVPWRRDSAAQAVSSLGKELR